MVHFWENAFRVLYNKDHEWVLSSLVLSYELEDQDLRAQLGMEGLLGMSPKSETFPDMEQSAGQCFGSKGDGASGTWRHSGEGHSHSFHWEWAGRGGLGNWGWGEEAT